MIEFRIGICEICKRNDVLKDNICYNCRKRHSIALPDCFKDLFGIFIKDEKKEDNE